MATTSRPGEVQRFTGHYSQAYDRTPMSISRTARASLGGVWEVPDLKGMQMGRRGRGGRTDHRSRRRSGRRRGRAAAALCGSLQRRGAPFVEARRSALGSWENFCGAVAALVGLGLLIAGVVAPLVVLVCYFAGVLVAAAATGSWVSWSGRAARRAGRQQLGSVESLGESTAPVAGDTGSELAVAGTADDGASSTAGVVVPTAAEAVEDWPTAAAGGATGAAPQTPVDIRADEQDGDPEASEDDLKKQFGARLQALRDEARYTRRELGDIVAYSEKTVARYEKGQARPVRSVVILWGDWCHGCERHVDRGPQHKGRDGGRSSHGAPRAEDDSKECFGEKLWAACPWPDEKEGA